jgi:hypothetical protein
MVLKSNGRDMRGMMPETKVRELLRKGELVQHPRRRSVYIEKLRGSSYTRISSGRGVLSSIGMSQVYTYCDRNNYSFKPISEKDQNDFFLGAPAFLHVERSSFLRSLARKASRISAK